MTFLNNLAFLIDKAENEAAHGCGQSDVLYEARVQDSYQSILNQAPQEDCEETKKALVSRGFDTEFTPYEAGSGECSLTGIEEDCCPCGRHE